MNRTPTKPAPVIAGVIETANREGTYEKKAEVFLKLIKEE